MSAADPCPWQRGVIKGVGVGLGMGLLAQHRVESALAQPASPPAIWSNEYRAKKGDVSLSMFGKRLGPPKAGEAARRVPFLVHRSSVSSRPSYDLTVPGAAATR